NRYAASLFGELLARGLKLRVRHLSGAGDPAPVRETYERARVDCEVVPFTNLMAAEYATADFIVSCAGAITLAEIAVAGLPALIVPLSGAAANHQSANACAFCEQTGARWSDEQRWNPAEEASWIAASLSDPAALDRLRAGAKRFARPDAARRLIEVCEDVLRRPPFPHPPH